MPTLKQFDFPLFPPGKHRANDDTVVELDFKTLQDLVTNTNFIIGKGILAHPPVGFRHPASRDRFAKGHIAEARYVNGVAHVFVNEPKFIDSAKRGDILEYSGEIGHVEYTEDGVSKKIGPAIVGIALLGDERPGIKDPRRKPLKQLVSEQSFGESLSAAQSWEIGEELRKAGVVAQTLDGDVFCFSEIKITSEFSEEEDEERIMPMTDAEKAEFQNMLKTTVDAATAPLVAKNTELEGKLAKFSESSKREGAAHAFCETFKADRLAAHAPLPKLFTEKLEAILSDPTLTDAQVTSIKALAESAPGAFVGGKSKDDDGKGEDEEDSDEPKALAKVHRKHFSDRDKFEGILMPGLLSFAEAKPKLFAPVKDKPITDQLEVFKTYIIERDSAAN